jgi:hypothetical protein
MLQLSQQVLGGGIGQLAGRVSHHSVNLPQPVGREQGRAQAVAMAHVVVAALEAVGGEDPLDVLAQGGRLTGE